MSWATAALGEIATIERNSVSPAEIASGSRYVGLEHIESGGGSLVYGTVSNGELASSKFRFGPHHILFGKLRPYLAKIACPDFEGICSTDILPISPGKLVDRRYLLHFLKRPQTVDWASNRATGVNLPRLAPSELVSLQIPLPPLHEQRRIAAILDQADALRRKRKQALNLLDSLMVALANSLSGFEKVTLGELIIDGPTNGLYKPSSSYGEGVPIVRINNFYDGKIVDLNSLRRLDVTSDEQTRFGLKEGDIVINRVNSLEYLGKSTIVEVLPEPTVYESNMMRFAVDSARMLPEVCIALLQTENVRRQILGKAKNAVNQSSINQRDVKGIEIPLPPMELQLAFRRRSREASHCRLTYSASRKRVEALFASLQHRAFSGQL